MSANVGVTDATRRVRFGQFSCGEMGDDFFVATIDGEEFRVEVTPLCMSRFMPKTCLFDTNGDGDCGQPGCPVCGANEARKPYRCSNDRDHSGMHADRYGIFNWTDEDEVK